MMVGIKGNTPKKTNSYADAARQNSEQEQQAMRLKKEQQAQLQNEALTRAMVEMANANNDATDAKQTPVVAQVEPIPDVAQVKATPVVAPAEVAVSANAGHSRRSSVKKDVGELATFSEGSIKFNGQFLIKELKKKEYSTIGFSAPVDIALEVKVKAARDKISLFELNNLLLALYLEKGLPKEFLERYKKSF